MYDFGAALGDEWGEGDGYDALATAHRNNPHGYSTPDERQRMFVGLSNQAVVVAPSDMEGRSIAFDADDPGVINIDPHAPDGGAQVNLSQLTKNDMRQAFSNASRPHQVYYNLDAKQHAGAPTSPQERSRQRRRDIQSQYAQPSKDMPYRNENQMQPIPAVPQPQYTQQPLTAPQYPPESQQYAQAVPAYAPAPAVQQQPAAPTAYAPPQPQYQQPMPAPQVYQPTPQMPPQPSPEMQQMMSMMSQMASTVGGMSQQIASLQQQAEQRTRRLPAAMPPPEAEPPRRKRRETSVWTQPVDQDDEDEDDQQTVALLRQREQEDIDEGPMPDDDEEIVAKPRVGVCFKYDGFGDFLVMYHDVVENDGSISLVFDRRYKDGTRYKPPDRGTEIVKVQVERMVRTRSRSGRYSTDSEVKTYYCTMHGINTSVGNNDISIMLTHRPPESVPQGGPISAYPVQQMQQMQEQMYIPQAARGMPPQDEDYDELAARAAASMNMQNMSAIMANQGRMSDNGTPRYF